MKIRKLNFLNRFKISKNWNYFKNTTPKWRLKIKFIFSLNRFLPLQNKFIISFQIKIIIVLLNWICYFSFWILFLILSGKIFQPLIKNWPFLKKKLPLFLQFKLVAKKNLSFENIIRTSIPCYYLRENIHIQTLILIIYRNIYLYSSLLLKFFINGKFKKI